MTTAFHIAAAFAACYFAVSLLVVPWQQAGLMAGIAGLSLLGVSVLTRSASPFRPLQWFGNYPLRGLFVLALTCTFPVIGIFNDIAWSLIAIELPLVFLWFWLFAAVGTYFRAPSA
jgi:hypothetical protein